MTGALEVQATEELTSLYELHAPLVRRVCRRMLGDAPDLDDAVQLTFLRAYRSLLRGSGPREADAWLTAIARNVCRTQLRERLERPAEELGDADLPLTPALTEEADRREDINAVLSAVGDLPRREREAVVLQAFAGFSNAEAAVLLGTTESGVESLLQRARARLRVVVAPTRSLGLAAPWVRSVFAALGRGDGIAAPLGAAAVIVFLAPAPVGRAGPPAATRPAGTTSPISRPSVRPAVAVARRRPAGRVVLSLPGRLRGAATSQIPAREAIASETSAASESTGPAAAAPTPAPTTAPAPAAPATSSNPAQAGGSTTATSTAAAMTVPLTGVGTEDANADASVTASATTGSDGSVSVSADASVEVSVTTPVVTTTTEVSGGVGVDLP